MARKRTTLAPHFTCLLHSNNFISTRVIFSEKRRYRSDFFVFKKLKNAKTCYKDVVHIYVGPCNLQQVACWQVACCGYDTNMVCQEIHIFHSLAVQKQKNIFFRNFEIEGKFYFKILKKESPFSAELIKLVFERPKFGQIA